MSRNNLIACVRWRGRYYVFGNVCADVPVGYSDYDEYVRSHIHSRSRYTYDWGRALVRAHRLQNKTQTEYGVQMVYL